MIRCRLVRLAALATIAGLAALLAGLVWLGRGLPSLDDLPDRLNPPSVRILDRHGRLLYESIPAEGGRNTVVPLERIPLALQQATIATEDSRFYTNPGIDPVGILRAAWFNLRGGETLSGASTITQQVARNLILKDERQERTLERKLREALLAWRLTRRYTKSEILALYLNQSYYGGMAYGVEAAAQTYFGKPVEELDLAESAMLAGLPQAPGIYNPFTDPEAAHRRQDIVLGLMESQGFITAEQHDLANRETLIYASTPYPMEAPHFVMFVRAQVDQLFSQEEVYRRGGLSVRTSLDLDWQKHADRAIHRQLESLQHSEDGLGHNVNGAALTAMDPSTGQILAMVGSPDYFDPGGGAINMALSPRQPGSALKPLVYAVALDPSRPEPWTAATALMDVRTAFLTRDGKAYTPENYDRTEHGPVLLRTALASSLNIPAVETLDHIGLEALFDAANRVGITTFDDPAEYDLSLALGGGAVRLLDLTAAYGAFASGGYRVDPQSILEISSPDGEVLYRPPARSPVRVVDPRVAWLISDILSDDQARIVGFGANSVLRLDRPAAVKTGTTSNFHDNWTVGYTPDLVVGVWVGNTNYEPMREVTGLTGAAPIWHGFMRTVLSGRPALSFTRPDGLVQVEVCSLSGALPGLCPYRRGEWFIAGTQPTQVDSYFREVVLDASSGAPAGESTPPDRRITQLMLDLPPQLLPWARREGLALYTDLVGQDSSGSETALRLASPPDRAVYHLAGTWQAEAQRLRLEAVGQAGLKSVTLWVDGQPVATLDKAPYATYWQLRPGQHQAWAEAELPDGTHLTSPPVTFTVTE